MPRKKSLAKKISRKELDDEEFWEGLGELVGQSDRVAAIVGAATVEHGLQVVIADSLADGSNESALFYDSGAPFGTFSNRIVAGKALGCFDQAIANDLNIIRDIRNQFAHALMKIDFSNPDIARECDRLSDRTGGRQPEGGRQISSARWRFERACLLIYAELLFTASQRRSASPAAPLSAKDALL